MNTNAIATIRSVAAFAVGAAVAALTDNFGIELDGVATETITAAVAVILSGIYGAVVRWATTRWPSLGFLLVVPTNPDYGNQPMTPGPPV
jgi:hypothetical protein